MLEEKLRSDLKEAQLARDEVSVSTLRLLLSELRNAEISKGSSLSDTESLNVIRKEAKKRHESAAAFRQGGRSELADKEESEAAILEKYLPSQLPDEEVEKIIESVISQTGASSVSEMGKVMGQVLSRVDGQADPAKVAALVKQKLSV